jgi:hypothetical protein
MTRSPDDSQIRELVQRVKRADARRAPDFNDVLERSVPEPNRRPARRLQVAVACCTAATLLIAFLLVRSRFDDRGGKQQREVVQRIEPLPTKSSPQGDRVEEIDFDDLRAAVDRYFRNTEAAAVAPDWSVRTDSLLALKLDIPLTEE